MTKTQYETVKPDNTVSVSGCVVPLPGPTFNPSKSSNNQLFRDQSFLGNTSGRITYPSGKQITVSVSGWGSGDMTTIMAQAAALSNPVGGSLIKNYRVYCKSLTSKIFLSNQTNDIMKLTLYDCYVKRDTPNANYFTPDGAWFQGLTDQTPSAVGTSIGYQMLGAQPFTSAAFCDLYTVSKITNVVLHTGGHHVHTTNSYPKKNFENEFILANGASTFTGFTHFTMIVAHGFPINDNATTTVTTASGALDYVATRSYTFQVVQQNNSQYIQNNTLSLAPAQQDVMNDLTGATTTLTTI